VVNGMRIVHRLGLVTRRIPASKNVFVTVRYEHSDEDSADTP
jgi:hypothetical protein